jgi:hypothetical protein
MKRDEIENQLKIMSDFLKMEFLEGLLKKGAGIEEKKFICQKLGELYAGRNMFAEATKNMDKAAEAAIAAREKIDLYLKEIDLAIRAGNYFLVDEILRKIMGLANAAQKLEIKQNVKNFYIKQAEIFEKTGRRGNALKVYEIVAGLADESEKKPIIEKLLFLYDRLGKIREGTLMRERLAKM